MSKIFEQIPVELDESLEEKLQLLSPGFSSYHILRQSVDARQRVPHWVYRIEVFGPGEVPLENTYEVKKLNKQFPTKPVIIGAGPAGLFAALRLVEAGVQCILVEQGSEAPKRMRAIADYWRNGRLDKKNNVCYGEGGAGLYSDGKLITRIKSPHIPYVLSRLIRFGAPAEIQYLANPHVGSDKIRKVIPPLREFLKSNGCEVHFDSTVTEILFEGHQTKGIRLENGKTLNSEQVILATGHSSGDILHFLHERGVAMEGKSFAVGLRIEHPQKEINRMQYRAYAEHPKLGAANYRLADHDKKTGVGVYSFCMCPGGYVVASGTETDSIVSNGMSNYKRNSPYANSAIVVSLDHNKIFGTDIFGGLKFRRELELKARSQVLAQKGTKQFPAQLATAFLDRKLSTLIPSSAPSGAVATRLDELFEKQIYQRLCEALEKFDLSLPGFLSPEAQLFGVESRTSCPVRIIRDSETLQSVTHRGFYPAGEGAGYAGGITSAAVDGVKVADAMMEGL